MSDVASRDANDVPSLLGVSNVDGTSTVKIYADPVTHRLLVDSGGSGGNPGGNNTDVQFNDNGSFGGQDNFAFNKTTGILTIGTITAPAVTQLNIQAASGQAVELLNSASSGAFSVQDSGSILFAPSSSAGTELLDFSSGKGATLDTSLLSADRSFKFPDASGTFALTTNIPSFADNEIPSGTINSSNVTFTLAHTPSPAGSLQLFLNGSLQQAGGGDYTLTTNSIAFGSAPLTGSIMIAWYRY